MPNPLLLLSTNVRSRRSPLRRARVPIPRHADSTDVVFLVLRRMRGPLISVIAVLTIAVIGLSLIPGVDSEGHPYRMTPFEAFYVMSYTATTIGFGEVPYPFTTQQRLWMTVCIYASVTVWAYSIGALFALLQDESFRDARARQRFRRRVARMREPFLVVCGYGQTGRAVCRALDELGRAFVVIDRNQARLDLLATDQLMRDAPALEADAGDPAVLGLAGLGHPRCEGLVALTDDDEANLSVVMAGHLLRPELPVIVRASDRGRATHMADFSPQAVVNPDDHYGAFLMLALQHPEVSRLVEWLMATEPVELPERRDGLGAGRWIVLSDGEFGEEVERDLRAGDFDVTVADPKDGCPDLTGIAGFVAGSSLDATNLAFAARARMESPEAFITVRQRSRTNAALVAAFEPDSVYVPSDLVAREVLARVVTPLTWGFVEFALQQDDAWGARVLETLVAHSGTLTPTPLRITVDRRHAPAVTRRLARHDLTIGDLLRDPEDRESHLRATCLTLVRGEEAHHVPDESTPLADGDQLLLAGRDEAFAWLSATLFEDAAVEYVATGAQVPTAWVWRTLTRRHRRPRA